MCTHSHFDHYNSEILSWGSNRDDIHYILAAEIGEKQGFHAGASYVNKGDEYQDSYISVKAFGSTDLGVSYYVEVDNYKIFYAGDLNNWHWSDESTAAEVAEAEAFFHRELADIAAGVPELDLAIFPADYKLGTDWFRGAKEFIETIPCKIFSPMHFYDEFDKIIPFEKAANNMKIRCIAWRKKGQEEILFN